MMGDQSLGPIASTAKIAALAAVGSALADGFLADFRHIFSRSLADP